MAKKTAQTEENPPKKQKSRTKLMVFAGIVLIFIGLYAVFMIGGWSVEETLSCGVFWMYWLVLCSIMGFYFFVKRLVKKLYPHKTEKTAEEGISKDTSKSN